MNMTPQKARLQEKNIAHWSKRVERIEALLEDEARAQHHEQLRKELEHRKAQITVWQHELANATIVDGPAEKGEISA